MATGTITQAQIQPFTPWWLLTSVDLHHVTGLSLLLLAALVRFRPGWLFLGGVVLVGLPGPLLRRLCAGAAAATRAAARGPRRPRVVADPPVVHRRHVRHRPRLAGAVRPRDPP